MTAIDREVAASIMNAVMDMNPLTSLASFRLIR